MNAGERDALRHAIDARRRELSAAPVCPTGRGSEYGYHLGCRCDACRADATRRRNDRKRRNGVKTHGTHGGYANGCRCDACREGNSTWRREHRRRKRLAAADACK